MPRNHHRQSGLSTFAAIGAFVGLGVVFLTIFFLAGSSSEPVISTSEQSSTETKTTDKSTENIETTTTSKEPPYIRIPENSEIYNNTLYGFMFAYPDSFGKLTPPTSSPAGQVIFRTESALADQKPIGIGTAFLNGRLGAYVYKKSDFKIVIKKPDVTVAPTKTGNDTTWKIIDRGSTGQDISVGDSYAVKTVKSQTGVPVFDFSLNEGTSILARWVFEVGDNYVLIAMPNATKPNNAVLEPADIAAYNVVGSNMARTVRLPSKTPETTQESTSPSSSQTTQTTTTD